MSGGFPGGLDSKRFCLQCRRPRFNPWVGKIPWRRKWQPTPVLLPGKSYGQGSLGSCSPLGRRVRHDWATSLHFFTSGGTSGKESACQCRRFKRPGFHPWVGKIPWRRSWQPTPIFLPGGSHPCLEEPDGLSPWGCKESDTTEAIQHVYKQLKLKHQFHKLFSTKSSGWECSTLFKGFNVPLYHSNVNKRCLGRTLNLVITSVTLFLCWVLHFGTLNGLWYILKRMCNLWLIVVAVWKR